MNHTTSTLEVSFLRSCVLLCAFKGQAMKSAQACLLMIALKSGRVLGSDLPGEITNGSRHLAGAACGSMVALGLLEVIAREKSQHENAKGRRVNVYAIPEGKHGTVKAFLKSNGFPLPELVSHQLNLLEVG